MTYVLIALVASSFIFEYWLLTKINNLNKEKFRLQKALFALNQDLTNFQAGISRDLDRTNKSIEGNLGHIKRIDRKVDVSKRDIMNPSIDTSNASIKKAPLIKPVAKDYLPPTRIGELTKKLGKMGGSAKMLGGILGYTAAPVIGRALGGETGGEIARTGINLASIGLGGRAVAKALQAAPHPYAKAAGLALMYGGFPLWDLVQQSRGK